MYRFSEPYMILEDGIARGNAEITIAEADIIAIMKDTTPNEHHSDSELIDRFVTTHWAIKL